MMGLLYGGESVRRLLKILNPFIWLINMFMYTCHLESYRHCDEYESYDFSKDLKYF